MKNKMYLLNSPVLTAFGEWSFKPMEVSEARKKVQVGFTSAIGHETAAQFLKELLAVEVPTNRIAITMEVGDQAIVLRIKERLPEGKVLSCTEMDRIPFELGLLHRRA
jgi:hypothetical protein